MTAQRSTKRTRRGPKSRLHQTYRSISEAERIKIVYLSKVHRLPLHDIELELGIQYNSIRNILKIFDQTGLTDKRSFKRKGTHREVESDQISKVSLSLPSYVGDQQPESGRQLAQKETGKNSKVDQADLDKATTCTLKTKLSGKFELSGLATELKDVTEPSGSEMESPLRVVIVLKLDPSEKNNLANNLNRWQASNENYIDKSSSRLRLLSCHEQEQDTQSRADSQSLSDEKLHLASGGPNEGREKNWKLSPSELAQFKTCTAYINPFPGSLSYLNTYADPVKRNQVLGIFEESQRPRAAHNMKTLPAFSFSSSF